LAALAGFSRRFANAPAYPTGHGTVGGACITLLKFFFDGNFVIPNPVVPTSDGLSLVPYTGSDAGQLTVNGELNKLGHNVTFGYGTAPAFTGAATATPPCYSARQWRLASLGIGQRLTTSRSWST
jgi:hypothetical protein